MVIFHFVLTLLIWSGRLAVEAETSSTCLLEKESDFRSLEGDAVVGTLPRGLIVASAAAGQSKEIGGQKWIRIEYPKQGWILSSICQPVSESQVCNEKNRLARTFNTGDHILGSCVASPSSNWVDQWPVGGSKLGAMVGSGGTFGLEIVPFSIADLFFMNSNHMTGNVNFQKEYVVGSPHEKSFSEFKSARSSFQKGDLVGADKHLKEMKQEATGRFEYIGDIALAFAPPASMGKAKDARLEAESRGPRKSVLEGLQEALKKVRPGIADLTFFSAGIQGGGDPSHISHLDLSGGVSSTSFMLSGDKGQKYLQHRSWLASSVDAVLMGQFKCTMVDGKISGGAGCMNIAMHLSRSKVGKEGNNPGVRVKEAGKQHKKDGSDTGTGPRAVVYKLALSMFPERHTVAHTFAALAVVCEPPRGSGNATSGAGGEGAGDDHLSGKKPFRHHGSTDSVICRGGDSVTLYVAVEKEDNLETMGNLRRQGRHQTDAVLKKLEAQAWSRVDKAIQLGPEALERRQRDYMSERMHRTQLTLLSTQGRDDAAATHMAMFEYGRYLLLSGGNAAALNLQGLWADGKQSTWNGDYHMNINLQMMYWAADSVGLGAEAMPPLVEFLKRLRVQGERTARQLYNCRGWVAHGFTDGYMGGGVPGDLKWAYCVSCGAWAALSLWDHVSFADAASPSYALAMAELLTSFQGIAAFFTDYMTDVGGTRHTGPTTSPENSYSVKRDSTYLIMSPAIDLSILRNVADAYSRAAASLDQGDTKRAEHVLHAGAFASVVSKMHNRARPSVHPKTGLIQEYPVTSSGDGQAIDEGLDVGHRHYSGMHWLYPGFSPPAAPGPGPAAASSSSSREGGWLPDELSKAAHKTLAAKRADNGAHTSWSSSWEACLWARLGKGEEALQAVQRILDTYTTPHLMSLHPKLMPAGARHCETCFRERSKAAPVSKEGQYPAGRGEASLRRAMTTREEGIFQLDGNLGYLAAVSEMLVQSHEVGIVRLLPAMPAAWMQAGGEIVGLRARGDVQVSIRWKQGVITAARIVLNSAHPYHNGVNGRLLIVMPTSLSSHAAAAAPSVSSECASTSADPKGVAISLPAKSHPCPVIIGNW